MLSCNCALRSCFHPILFLQPHARLKLSAQLIHRSLSSSPLAFLKPAFTSYCLFLSPCSLPPTPPSTQIQRSAHTPLSFLKPARFPQASVHFVLPLPFTLLSSSNSTLDANLTLSSDARAFLEPALFSHPCAWSVQRSFFHLALFLQLHPRRQLNAQLRRPLFPQACSLFSPPRSVRPALFLSPCSLSSSPRSTQTQQSAQTPSLFSPPRSIRTAFFFHLALPFNIALGSHGTDCSAHRAR